MSEVCKRIKKVRKSLELTQKEFCEPLGISRSHLSGIEIEREEPSTTLLLLIYEIYLKDYGFSKDWLLYGKDGKKDE